MSVLGEDVGIATADGFECLIPKWTDLAGHLEYTSVFSTHEDNQMAVKVTLLAATPTAKESPRMLGQLVLTGIEPAPRALPRIELRIKLTATGRVELRACDLGTGNVREAEFSPVAVLGNALG